MLTIHHRTVKDPRVEVIPVVKVGCWINVVDPTKDEVTFLTQLGLLPENIDDALDPDELPRVEVKDDRVYIILNTPFEENGVIRKIPLLLVIFHEFLVTICKHNLDFIPGLLSDRNVFTTQKAKNVLQICLKVTEAFTQRIRRIDKSMAIKRGNLTRLTENDIIGMVELEEVLNEFNSSLVAQIGVFQKILSSRSIEFFKNDKELTEDLIIDSRQCQDMCSTSLKTINNIREAYSAILTNNLNRVIKFLTSLTALLAVPTIVSSMFGMNVPLPLSEHPMAFGFIALLTILLMSGAIVFFYFKRWL